MSTNLHEFALIFRDDSWTTSFVYKNEKRVSKSKPFILVTRLRLELRTPTLKV